MSQPHQLPPGSTKGPPLSFPAPSSGTAESREQKENVFAARPRVACRDFFTAVGLVVALSATFASGVLVAVGANLMFILPLFVGTAALLATVPFVSTRDWLGDAAPYEIKGLASLDELTCAWLCEVVRVSRWSRPVFFKGSANQKVAALIALVSATHVLLEAGWNLEQLEALTQGRHGFAGVDVVVERALAGTS